ncbi:MFS transporter [Kocuria sp.]|uniref:MFS transporter n=1 Tax=Kocuria sp. TaxID=1871328 RepID=UPI0026E0A4EE|nr:MFS transporter [Kocuria sp.]MDO5619381.1 MFS transporter [Kocuria sp.]
MSPQKRYGRDSAMAYLVIAVGILAYFTAVAQRTSFGVASLEAADRFQATASQLSLFTMLQVFVYAGLQIPVGVLVDRFGSRMMVAVGAVLMAAGQVVLALADSLGWGVAGRVLVGAGDAATFICVLRIIPAWFSLSKTPVMTMLVGTAGNFGQLLSVVPFSALLGWVGWTPSFLAMAALSVVVAVLVVAFLRDTPDGQGPVNTSLAVRRTRAAVIRCLREPATALGFWVHFTVQFIGTVFALMWGYPYLQNAQGLSLGQASFVMTFFVLTNFLVGMSIGSWVARRPNRRVQLSYAVIAAGFTAWAVLILWPGTAPFLVVLAAVVAIAMSLPASMVAFNIVQSFTPRRRIGTATGITNVGGFVASLAAIYLIGLTLDLQVHWGWVTDAYAPEAFRVAMAMQVVVAAVGVAGMAVSARRVRARYGAQSV